MQPGSRLGPYEIVAPLGAGGMGEVYRARDTRLGRDVAIKVLPAEYAADAERLRRFEREARATAALDHPNILAVFDTGTHDGMPYIVEQLLEGESLRVRLDRGSPPIGETVAIADQLARGLAAAHEKHIVHRDLKPENVIITRDGVAKILDFGLAKLIEAAPLADADTLSEAPSGATAAGRVLGTLAYMAPEQVRGQPVDPRADIFALGVVLYELLSGSRPFRGGTWTDTAAAILKEGPAPLPPGVPAPLRGIVDRCLEKRREDRYQSARELSHDLEATLAEPTAPTTLQVVRPAASRGRLVVWSLAGAALLVALGGVAFRLMSGTPSTAVAPAPKIVVLPFENLGAAEDAYFAAGMTDEITGRLANVHGLAVISRTSAVHYDRSGKTVKEIGRDLGVEYVLEGSVRWEHGAGRESRVRITPQLIRVADDTHVWADRYDRVLADVFAIQSEVSERAVTAMGVTLLPSEQRALREISTGDLAAYDLYLRGLDLSRLGLERQYVEGALRMHQAAVDRDPSFAQALAALARQHLWMNWLRLDHSPERVGLAKDAAERAVELRPDLTETHNALGWYFLQALADCPRALDEFAAARSIQPRNGDALFGVAGVLRRQGRWDESAVAFGEAAELDPRDALQAANLGEACILSRRYAEAGEAYRRATDLNPRLGLAWGRRAWLQIQWRGDVGRAQALIDEARRVEGLTDTYKFLADAAVSVCLARSDLDTALRELETWNGKSRDAAFAYRPVALLRGEVQTLAGQGDAARRSFDDARVELEGKVAKTPDDPRLHSSLGLVYAALGRPQDAIREASLGSDLAPVSRDAWAALWRLEDLAAAYTMVGRSRDALAALDDLLGRSGWFTTHVLRLDPVWNPLRSDPRFQELLAKHEVRE